MTPLILFRVAGASKWLHWGLGWWGWVVGSGTVTDMYIIHVIYI